MPDPGAGRAGGRAGDAGGHAHRPRLARRRGRAASRGEESGDQAGRRLRAVRHRRPHAAGEGLRPPDRPGRVERGLCEPDQALVARLPGGLLLQAARRLGAARAPRARPGRALGLPVRPRLEGAGGGEAAGRRRRSRPARPDLRKGLDVRRDPERRPRAAAADQPAAGQARRDHRPAARGHRRRPLPAARRRARPRGAALHPVRRLAEESESLALRHRPVLLQDAGRDGGGLRRVPGRAAPDARGGRALQRRDRARTDPAAALPGAGRSRCVRVPRRAVRGRPRRALRAGHGRAARAPPVRAEDGPRDGLRRLLPHRLGLHPLRPRERRQRRAGPRLRGRLPCRLLPAASPTSTRCGTGCCSNVSSTRPEKTCRTWTSTSRSRAGTE